MSQLRRNLGQTPSKRVTAGTMAARDDEMVHQKCELIGNVMPGLNLFKFQPGKSGCLVLDKLGGIYDNWKLNSASVEYQSGVSTGTNGFVTLGVDYNPSTAVTTEGQVRALTGSTQSNVYKDTKIQVSQHKAQKQTWFSTASAGVDTYEKTAFVIAVYAPTVPDVTSVGSIWVHYSVRFSSINVSSGATEGNRAATASQKVLPGITSPALNTDPVADSVLTEDGGVLAFKDNPVVNSDQPTDVANVTEPIPAEEFHEVGDTVTIASFLDTDVSLFNAAPAGAVNFYYTDGTPVESGAIQSFAVQGSNSFSAGHGVVPHDREALYRFDEQLGSSLLADVFSIVKPLVKNIPVVGEIVSSLFDEALLNEVPPPVIVVEETAARSIYVLNAAAYPEVVPLTNAIAIGETITAQLPSSNSYNSVDNAPFTYIAVMGQLSELPVPTSLYETNSGPYEATLTYIPPAGSGAVKIPEFIELTPVAGAAPIRAGDMFTFDNVRVHASPGGGTGNALHFTGDVNLENMDVADGQGLPAINAGRSVTVKRDSDKVKFRLPTYSGAGEGTVVTFTFTFARQSRCDSITQSDIPSVVSRPTRRLHR